MAEIKFEEALKKLEKIVSELEKENIPLDSAFKKFEEGIKLSRICTQRLKQVEKKIEVLVKNDGGEITK
ncbi:MAG: exodeoxyribonuclease VII small subunit, partial [Candidatus Ratteibacteria bacterium]|nr:exodeoxyribonuclease VII small subunit [Candidatus Ratteibacteria bacterium]